jgi:Zn-dependent M28 family amino/carboxypeptidase
MVADVNMDMIGRNAPDTVVAIGMPYSDLGDRIERVVREHPALGLTVAEDPWPDERFFFRSDHYNFAIAGVPAIFLFAGVHPDYHRPSDEADRTDAGKIARVGTAAFLLGLGIAGDPDAPRWTAAGRKAVRPASR